MLEAKGYSFSFDSMLTQIICRIHSQEYAFLTLYLGSEMIYLWNLAIKLNINKYVEKEK